MKKHLTTWLLLGAILLFSACSFPASEKEPKAYIATREGMFDTVSILTGYSTSKEDFDAFADLFFTKLFAYNRLYDIYTDYPGINNLKTVNDCAGISPVKVDSRILDLLEFGITIHHLTNGACNIGYGAVLSLWHKYRTAGIQSPETATLPSERELADAARHTAIENIVIDREASTVYLTDPLASLDVGAIAKGYATEMVCREMESLGYTSFAANIGGNLRVIGSKPGGEPWGLAIRNPNGENIPVERADTALVTSGIYERYYTVDGINYHHIIDPATAYPGDRFVSVTVIIPQSGLADALSTALFCMSADEGLAFLASNYPEADALWILPSGEIRKTPGLDGTTLGGGA